MASGRERHSRCVVVLCGLLLAACAHLPEHPGPAGASGHPAADEQPPIAPSAEIGPPTRGDVRGPIAPPEVDDLFERMRAGLSLQDFDHPSVERQLDWYRSHPAYLQRSLGRARRYLHHIVESLEDRDMPLDLALLPIVESGFDPFAYSSCGAAGLWQFMDRTGRHYGLERSWWYEGRRDVVDATRAALDYLQALHDEFDGDWLLALAAYNAGERNVQRAVERAHRRGLPGDFFDLDLPRETRAYVPELLALSRLVAEPEVFGLELPEVPNTPYFALVPLDGQIDLRLAADLMGISLEELRALNPEFNRQATAPHGPPRLLVPVAARERFERALAELPPGKRLRFARHHVRRGETLSGIARHYRISIQALREANHLPGTLIRAGQDLLVPLSYRDIAVAAVQPPAVGSLEAGL